MKPTQRKWLGVVGLTLLFTGVFFGLRLIPVSQCEFLHYEPTAESAAAQTGEEELCSVAPVPFIDVEKTPFPVALDIHSVRNRDDGQVEILFSILGPDKSLLLPHELAVTHARRIHFMLIDSSMGSYHHLHPEPLADSGDYRVRFKPRAEQYRYFAEFVPLQTRMLSVADGHLEVGGDNIIDSVPEPPVQLELDGVQAPLRANRDHTLRLKLRHKEEGPLPIEETMDAYAHLVGFEDSLSGYAHMHPLTVDPVIGETAEMEFLFHPTRPGNFRIWVQIRANGEDIFRPFDVEVI